MYEYLVESRWVGWLGGYGSENAIARELNVRAAEGWRLVRSESARFLWWWWLPRVKLLAVWEREKGASK